MKPRYAGLDGLRGVALLLVLGYHLNLLGCGWVGVQLFFVLSGFLITRILLEARAELPPRQALGRFYLRRSLRIFPVFYLYLALMVGSLAILRPPTAAAQTALRHWPWAAAYAYNWFGMTRWHEPSYYLDHLWTLAVEEQFYLLWPALVLTLPRRALRWVLLGLVAAGPLVRAALARYWPGLDVAAPGIVAYAVGVCTLSHLDAFAAGALLNFFALRLSRLRRPAALALTALAGAYLLGAAVNGAGVAPPQPLAAPLVLGYPNTLPAEGQYVWGYSVLNLCAALLVGGAAHAGLWRRLLDSRSLAFVGRVSYGAYIFHLPLAHLMSPVVLWLHATTGAGFHASLVLFAPLYVATVLALAALSYRFFERPILAWRDRRLPA